MRTVRGTGTDSGWCCPLWSPYLARPCRRPRLRVGPPVGRRLLARAPLGQRRRRAKSSIVGYPARIVRSRSPEPGRELASFIIGVLHGIFGVHPAA